MLAINSVLEKVNTSIKTTGFQLILFLVIQLTGLMLAVASLHYIQVREQQLADMRLHYQNTVLRSNVVDQFEMLEAFADDLRYKLTVVSPWWNQSPDTGHLLLKSHILKTVPMVNRIQIFDKEGNMKFSSANYPVPPVNVSDRPYFLEMKTKGIDQLHFGPYIGRTFNRLTYSIIHKLVNERGVFIGVLLVAVDVDQFGTFCKNAVYSDSYDAVVLNPANEVIVWCSYNSVHKEAFSKPFIETKIGKGVTNVQLDQITLMNIDTPEYVLKINNISSYSGLKVITSVSKQGAYASMNALIWQNYMLLMVGLLSQTICFMMFNNSLKIKKSTPLPE